MRTAYLNEKGVIPMALTWGIVGTGSIAKAFARGLAGSQTGTLVAIGSRTRAAAEAFGDVFAVPRRHQSYDALLADPAVHAVYIATPHPQHAEWAIKAAQAGKHVLCEKPLALNHRQALAMIETARRHDVFLMEAFMYRCHPQTARLVDLIRDGAIGDVRAIMATFSFDAGNNLQGRWLSHQLGGGGILDVGCYPMSMARLLAGAATGHAFRDPIEVKGCGHIGAESRVDEYAIASLLFPDGIVAQIATGVRVRGDNSVRVIGSTGTILVPDPWTPAREGGATTLVIQSHHGETPQEIVIEAPQGLYTMEADTVASFVDQRQAPAMTWDDSLGNMTALDRWRASIGLVYEEDRPAPAVNGGDVML